MLSTQQCPPLQYSLSLFFSFYSSLPPNCCASPSSKTAVFFFSPSLASPRGLHHLISRLPLTAPGSFMCVCASVCVRLSSATHIMQQQTAVSTSDFLLGSCLVMICCFALTDCSPVLCLSVCQAVASACLCRGRGVGCVVCGGGGGGCPPPSSPGLCCDCPLAVLEILLHVNQVPFRL